MVRCTALDWAVWKAGTKLRRMQHAGHYHDDECVWMGRAGVLYNRRREASGEVAGDVSVPLQSISLRP